MEDEINIPLADVESEHCALLVDKAIGSVEGIKSHRVELNNRRAVILADPGKDDVLNAVVSKIRNLGYGVETLKKVLPVTGMSCASCAVSVQSILNSQKGVVKAEVNFAGNTVLVEYIPSEISPATMRSVVQSIGYDLVVAAGEDAAREADKLRSAHLHKLRVKTLASVVLSVPLVIIGMFFMHMPYANYIMWALATPVLLVFGRQFFVNAYKQMKNRSANMDTLVALSTGIAYIFSVFNTLFPAYWHSKGLHADVYFEASAVVVAFILLGKLLEERAKSNTSSAIRKLMVMQPDTVLLIEDDGTERTVPVSAIKKSDMVLVKPGERIPVDGEVRGGNSYVDESSITGEPVPAAKKEGDQVFAGTINQKGILTVAAGKESSETVLAHIIRMVQQAQGSKPPVQKLVDKIAGIFVPVILGIAVLTFAVWAFSGVENALTHAMLSMVTVLAIACPCALGLATPTAVMVGIGKAAEHGILIKDAESLETARNITALVLDKTGTVTEGNPSVTDMIWFSNTQRDLLEQVFYTLEKQSEHPLAEAVVRYIGSTTLLKTEAFESITGRGVKAVAGAETYFTGNEQLLIENGIRIAPAEKQSAEMLQKEGKTVIFFSDAKRVLAIAAITDKIKENSKAAVSMLSDKGVAVYMLSGDNEQTTATVAAAVGISNYKAGVLPSDKAGFVQSLQAKGHIVGMVGDGINDSHALAQADVSIAMGTGSDIAMDVAKMTIMSSDLMLIPKAIQLSKQTVKVIRQNLFWAFIYNLIGIPVAAGLLYPFNGFLLNPMIAGAAMALSSVSVVTNSLLLKVKKF